MNILTSIDQMGEFEQGQVLVADMTDPDWEPIMSLGGMPWRSRTIHQVFNRNFKRSLKLIPSGSMNQCAVLG